MNPLEAWYFQGDQIIKEMESKTCPECGGYDGDHDEDCDMDKGG